MQERIHRRSIFSLMLIGWLAACAPEAPPPQAPPPPDLSAGSGQPARSPGEQVSFFVLGKSHSFNQDADGKLSLKDLGYFGEIFKLAGGEASDAWIQRDAAGAEPIPFEHDSDNGAVLQLRSGKRHHDLAALDAELPNGDYAFNFSTPGGDVRDFVVTLSGPDGRTELPPPPVISLEQNGAPVAADAIAPGQPLRVSWTPFATGRADPNGIQDDLIFVMMSDCNGERAYHSGRPLNTPNPLVPDRPSASVLTFRDQQVTIPAEAIRPGLRYELDVEHAHLLDTDRRQGVVGMTTYAVSTYLQLQTSGQTAATHCPPD